MSFWNTFRFSQLATTVLRVDDRLRVVLSKPWFAPTPLGVFLRLSVAVGIGVVLALGVIVAASLPRDRMVLVLGAMAAPFAVMIVNNLRLLFLSVIPFEIALPIDTNLNYNYKAAEFSALGGFNISLTTMMLGVLYALWIAQLLAQQGKLHRSMPIIPIPHLLYFVVVACSWFYAYDPVLSLNEIILVFYALLIHIYIVSTVRNKAELHHLVIILMAAIAVQGVLMMMVRVISDDIYLGPIFVRFDSETSRVGGSTGSPNGTASYLTMLLPICVVALVNAKKHWIKLLAGGSFLLGHNRPVSYPITRRIDWLRVGNRMA
ncbi:MAG: hypothetical protein HC828_15660, partial [Blastochloris sp.]|nr:hypothetical protein [Blastochloris sp.]